MLKAITVSLAALTLVIVVTHSHAQSLQDDRPRAEIALSDDTLQLRYIDSGANIDVGRGSRVSGGFFLSESRDIVLSGDVLFPVQLDFDRLQILLGPRAYAALLEDENTDVFAVSVGAELRYELDRNSGLALAGQAFYAPDILTFGSANNLTDLGAWLEIRLQPRLTAFGGMRWFEFDLTEGGQRTLQEELFAGIGWRF
ncbi:MAG: YfaZ family outer membrane protein [Steroidobacteraceae bacterium]